MTKALQGERILVTRPAAQAADLAGKIVALGGEPIVFPLLEISPADDPAPLAEAIERLDEYATIVFISPNAVEFGLPPILARRDWPAGATAAAIGQNTAALLARHGIPRIVAPAERFDSESLLALDGFAAERVTGRRVLILRGNGGRELIADTLTARGAEVDCVTCYRRSSPADGKQIVSLLRNNGLDALTISSSEGLRNLTALLDTDACERLRALPVFVPHQRIADTAAALGLQRVILTAPADAGIIKGLCAYNWLHHE
jgi:uroporphyrinogen-III synthase